MRISKFLRTIFMIITPYIIWRVQGEPIPLYHQKSLLRRNILSHDSMQNVIDRRKLQTYSLVSSLLSRVVKIRGGSTTTNNISVPVGSLKPVMNNESDSISKNKKNDKGGLIREAIFPIYGHEIKKFFSMGMIKFLVVFVLTITRDVKDTLIVTSCGAESIAFLKVYGVLPAAAAFTIVYSKMSNTLNKDALYYCLCTPFFIFYLLFDLVIYPNRDKLQPTSLSHPPPPLEGLSFLVGLYQNWTFALYYIVSEIYSSVSIGLLFWQFVNDVITVEEAKRFYPLFGQLSSIAPIIAGQCVARVAGGGDFAKSLHILTLLTTLCGVGIMGLYKYCSVMMEKEAEAGLLDSTLVTNLQKRTKRPQLSLSESTQFLLQSRYLRFMAILVLGFGLAINFTDILWKSMVKDYFPDKLDYQRFMGYYSSTVGATTFLVIFLGSNVVKHLGWRIGALATPVMMAVLAVPFFGAIFVKGFGTSSKKMALVAVAFGALMSVLSKATKYALFDPTTQMAYIPLDEESKSKGKAAIDVLGSRVGKSLGALLLQACVVSFGSAIRASYVVGTMFYAVILSWVYSANNLAVLFEEYQRPPAAYTPSLSSTTPELLSKPSGAPPLLPSSSLSSSSSRSLPTIDTSAAAAATAAATFDNNTSPAAPAQGVIIINPPEQPSQTNSAAPAAFQEGGYSNIPKTPSLEEPPPSLQHVEEKKEEEKVMDANATTAAAEQSTEEDVGKVIPPTGEGEEAPHD